MDALRNDLRYTLRTLIKAPAFTLAAVAALTLGIGANVAIFSVVNAVLLKPVAAPDPDRVVYFMNTSPQGSGPAASPAKYVHWRQQSAVVQDVSAFRSNVLNYVSGGVPEQLRAGQVSADFFRLLRPVDAPLRQRSGRRRPNDRARRRTVHGHRHSGSRLRRRSDRRDG